MRALLQNLTSLTPILPSSTPHVRISMDGGRRAIYIPKKKYEALQRELGEKLFLVYEDGNFVVIAGTNGDGKIRMEKMPKSVIFFDAAALTRFVPLPPAH